MRLLYPRQQQVSALIAEIAAASREQSAGIGQVNTAIAQMDLGVQQARRWWRRRRPPPNR